MKANKKKIIATILILLVIMTIGILAYFLGLPDKIASEKYAISDRNKELNISICSFEKYGIPEGDIPVDFQDKDLQNLLFNEIRTLETFQHFYELYPTVHEEYFISSLQYIPNKYIKESYGFYKELNQGLELDSLVVRVMFDDGHLRAGTTAGIYNIYLDLCNNKVLGAYYCSAKDCRTNL